MERKVKLFIAMSLDGFIAGKNDDISWLSMVEKEGEDYGYAKFMESIDTYIIGRKTYDVILKMSGGVLPQAVDYKCYVISRQKQKEHNGIEFYSGEISQLIENIRSNPGKDIYCDGGAEIINLLLAKNLIDECTISIIPIILGEGIKLFIGSTPKRLLHAHKPVYFDTGLIQLKYTFIK